MADFSALISQIQADIKTNLNQEITGAILQQDLLAMVNLINQLKQDTLAGYSFYGAALSNGDSVNVTQNTFFLAGAGSYTINGTSVTISTEGISVIVYDSTNSTITNAVIVEYDSTPTQSSTKPVTSGGIYDAIVEASAGSGLAEAVLDTDSAGTEQEFTMRQSGGDGGAYYRRILGKSIAWNQLVDSGTTSVTIPSGHKYVSYINGTWAYGTSDGTAMAVTGGTDMVFDLTLMFGSGNEPTLAEFQAKYYLPYFDYNAGTLKHNAVTGVKSVGINLWDEEWENGVIQPDGTINPVASVVCSKNYIPVISGQTYYAKFPRRQIVVYYDSGKKEITRDIWVNGAEKTIQSGCSYVRFFTYDSTPYASYVIGDICINLSDASVNGTYFPHWSRSLDINITTKEDTDGNIPFPYGLMGAGSAADWADREGGEKRMGIVDLGSLYWGYSSGGAYFAAGDLSNIMKVVSEGITPNFICSKYSATAAISQSAAGQNIANLSITQHTNGSVIVKDSNITSADIDSNYKIAKLSGVYLVYELATPVPFKWAEKLNLGIKVDELGTEQALPALASTPTSAPFRAMTTYTMSVARMMDKLNNI